MHLRDTLIWSVCIILAAALLYTAGMRLDYINSQRQQMKLISNEPLENAPPSLAFATVAMGAFRGLVVDVLWMRADRLKDQGQFFDAKQLAEWITILQPRFIQVWEFHVWNMAYNISVAIPATQPHQRWQWVKNGYELLRDQGIPLNPKSILLYRELARIFQDKIGSVRDDAHKYYKLQLAMAMQPLLGPADNKYFRALAEASADWPQTGWQKIAWQKIIEDANLTPLITALKKADKAFENDEQFVSNYLSLRQNPGRFNPAAFKTIDSFRGTEALKTFDIFAGAYQLRNVWKLDPVLMSELNKTYGPINFNDPNKHLPLDWRHPDSHAIYWAVKGLQTAGREEFSIDETNTDRIVGHGLQNLFRNGKIFIYDMPAEDSSDVSSKPTYIPHKAGMLIKDTPKKMGPKKQIFLRSDLRMFEPYNNSMLAVLEKYKDIERKGTYESLQIGHRNMLKNALFSFYQAGHRKQAQKIYNQLKQLYPGKEEFNVPLVAFVRNRLREELENIGLNNANEIVIMMLRESYFRYAVRDDDGAASLEKMAKEAYDSYNKMNKPDEYRVDLDPFPMQRYFALIDFLEDEQFPPELRHRLLSRIEIEKPELRKQLEQQQEILMKQLEQSQ